jgi:uracil-DNA glycosylase
MEVNIESSWKKVIEPLFSKPYFLNIINHLKTEKALNRTIYPKGSIIFKAFHETTFDNVKVVLLGQDPYHQPNQAMGLSFSVPKGTKIPPSLHNIYKELQNDIGMPIPIAGDLTKWANQGVLLLNTSLTVRANEPASHQKIGWIEFTNDVIKLISTHKNHIVFILWGTFAHQKQQYIDATKHKILKSVHPSPLSAHKGFFGCNHFSKTNQYLVAHGESPIDWMP